jgi:tetrahydromethanopterin S-methyltransferase subunit G
MMTKSLPAVLQQALEYHVNKSQLTHDAELQGIYDRLKNLNEKVEFFKNKIKINREKIKSDT